MTNLTEQWEKDEIYKGTFYCKSKLDGHQCIAGFVSNRSLFDCAYNGTLNKGYWEVLAEVPSYEQWIMTKNLSERAHIEMYKARGEKVKLEKENTKLKELLKGAREVLKMVDTYCGDYDSINGFLIVEKINQVLGEEKND